MRLINVRIILKILSTILLIESAIFILCLPVVFIYGEKTLPFLGSAGLTLIPAVLFFFLSRRCEVSKASTRDGYIAVAVSWIMLTVMGTLPYLLGGSIPSFINAFFESSSGFTTTGSSIVADVEAMPFSILFYRSLTHWIGGIGIIVLVIIVLPSLRVTGYHLFSLESSLEEKIHPRTNAIGIRVLFIYMALTIAEIILLSLGDMNIFDSICHSFSTVATGCFSTRNTGIAGFSSYTQYIVMIFMFLAGTSQLVYYYMLKLNFKKVKQNDELWFYTAVVLIAGAIATFILIARTNKSIEESFREGFFQVISFITCTGFSSTDYLLWPVTGIILLFILMFAGGSTGSTSGGIKMARHLIVLKNIKNVFVKLNHPKAISMIKLNGKVVPENTSISILSFVALYLFIFLLGTLFLAADGSDMLTSASASATCLAGIGHGFGSIGPMSTFAGMPGVSKVFLSLLMIVGRLEIMTFFALFTKTFWKI
ncbi:MAG TPA: TrkH family potassium uptake protein [Bacteroidales bacterium]|nr:TrkH family potassium uptake protein [Bacteroidales bacterium]